MSSSEFDASRLRSVNINFTEKLGNTVTNDLRGNLGLDCSILKRESLERII